MPKASEVKSMKAADVAAAAAQPRTFERTVRETYGAKDVQVTLYLASGGPHDGKLCIRRNGPGAFDVVASEVLDERLEAAAQEIFHRGYVTEHAPAEEEAAAEETK